MSQIESLRYAEEMNFEQETRQKRRERKKRRRMPQHGKSLAKVYKDAVLKRRKAKP